MGNNTTGKYSLTIPPQAQMVWADQPAGCVCDRLTTRYRDNGGIFTSESKAVAELKVGERVQISGEAGDQVVVKLSRGLCRELCLGNQCVLMAHRLERASNVTDFQTLIDCVGVC